MLIRWSIGFFIIALIAALFGFGGIANDSANIAKILFFIFLVVFALTFLMHIFSGPSRR
jgi:uncharacterized membrane protein YtjA (UPF0391 family)